VTARPGLEPAPEGYADLLEQLKARVRAAQVRVARAANTEVLRLYWSVGRDILDRQEQAGWGSRVIDRLADDLRAEFPDQRGWGRRNLHYMRALAEAWPRLEDFVPHAVAQLPWGHVRVLLDQVKEPAERDWYARAAVEYGWSRDVLVHQVETPAARAARGGAVELRRRAAGSGLRARAADGP
jgi:predicted nuclease of restriction endonuclease-like (RecB) superfamily